MKIIQKAALVIASLASSLASAAIIPDSYNLLNGNTGSYVYFDESYNGAGCTTCSNASLSGGKGDLTDGIIANDNWHVVEAPAGAGPYVGWNLIDPTIVFHWNALTTVNAITFYFDDANGYGGVSAPGSVTVNGTNYLITDPAGAAPFSFTATGFGFTGNDLNVTIFRNNAWIMLSEVQFRGDSINVPEPGSMALLLAGLAAFAGLARRRRSK